MYPPKFKLKMATIFKPSRWPEFKVKTSSADSIVFFIHQHQINKKKTWHTIKPQCSNLKLLSYVFLELYSTMHVHSSLWIHARKSYSDEHLRRRSQQILEINRSHHRHLTVDESLPLKAQTPLTNASKSLTLKSWWVQ